MGFIFRKRIKIAPGITVNIGKKGISSISIGGKGGSINLGKKSVHGTTSIPGTGLSYRKKLSGKTAKEALKKEQIAQSNPEELMTDEVIFKGLAKVVPAQEFPTIYNRFIKLDQEDRFKISQQIDFKDPRKVRLISIFIGYLAIDRFYIGDKWLGALKLASLVIPLLPLCWWLFDIFYLPRVARKQNAIAIKDKLF